MKHELSKEQLLAIADTDHVQCGDAAAMARALLASHEQEPVGEVIELPCSLVLDGMVHTEPRTYREIKGINKMKRMPLGTKFYTHPAPSIPAAAEPVAVVELSDYVTAAQLSGEEPRKKAVKELYEGALVVGQNLYTHAAPIPAAVPEDIDSRIKSAGMLSVAHILSGQSIDAMVKHSGVVDMASLLKWAEMRRGEFLRMQAGYELGEKEKDDLYEWVISHVGVFTELHVNIRAAMLKGGSE